MIVCPMKISSLQPARAVLLVGLSIVMAGCVSTSSAPVYESAPSNGPYRAPVESAESRSTPAPVERDAPAASATTSSQVAIRPGSADSDRTAKAVADLLDSGWQLFNQERFDASISVAERAMRIDRFNPEVYLLLARNYLAQWQLGAAEQIARQGLSVSNGSPSTRQDLEQVLEQIESQKE